MVLCAGFAVPIGPERGYGTTYARLAGLSARFGPAGPVAGAPALETGPREGAAPPASSPEPLAAGRVSGSGAPRPAKGRRKHRGKGAAALADIGVATSTRTAVPQPDQTPPAGPSPLDGLPQAAPRPPAVPVDDSPEALREMFEADPSKFPLDAKAWAEGVFLRLAGLCKVKSGYIVKVAVTNRSSADFFIQELGAYNGEDMVSVRSHIRLFVEPGRTRDGYVVVAPPPGAQVKIKLKEDREKGRVLEVPVRYPF